MTTHPTHWICGAAEADITPAGSVFLYGYPHVERYSTGVHDPLRSSAMYLTDGTVAVLFIANDIIWVPRAVAAAARRRISHAAGIPVSQIMVTATHTHSGPITSRMLSNSADPVVPPPDAAYLRHLEDGIVAAAMDAICAARPATLEFAHADGAGLGTNRHDPLGPRIPRVPLLVARDRDNARPLAVMAVCNMHPTVLHEDWQQISGDFPGLAREHLRRCGLYCPFIYHMGAAGNQSPRHVVSGNTIAEAERLGRLLAERILTSIDDATALIDGRICCQAAEIDLPLRDMPEPAVADAQEHRARQTLQALRAQQAPPAAIRTAECDLFGAEETVTLTRAAADGLLARAAAECLPAEVQVFSIGGQTWIGWPGEVFVEFALEIIDQFPNAAIITLANSDLQGYLVTGPAVERRTYEAGNGIFRSPESGRLLVETTLRLLNQRQS